MFEFSKPTSRVGEFDAELSKPIFEPNKNWSHSSQIEGCKLISSFPRIGAKRQTYFRLIFSLFHACQGTPRRGRVGAE
jgi:hypothetical protein